MKSEKYNILHISDLHFSENCILNDKKFMQNLYENISKIKDEFGSISNLIVTGDLVDIGNARYMGNAFGIIHEIAQQAGITESNIIIVPGNSDIEDDELVKHYNIARSGDENLYYSLHGLKQPTFEKEYNDFYIKNNVEREFNVDRYYFDVISNEKMCFLLINSNYYYGKSTQPPKNINMSKMQNELDQIMSGIRDDILVIPVGHSILNIGLDDENEEILAKYNFRHIQLFISGFIHNNIKQKQYSIDEHILTTGKLGVEQNSDATHPCFAVYRIDCKKNITNGNNEVKYKIRNNQFMYDKDDDGKWSVPLRQPTDTPIEIKLSTLNPSKITGETLASSKAIETTPLNQNCNWLMKIIKDKKLYKSGHFHFSESRMSLSMIRTDDILSNKIYRRKIALELFKSIQLNTDLYSSNDVTILGFGIEGNILGATLMMYEWSRDKQYIYYPDHNEGYNEFEKRINEDTLSSTLLILTDVVNTGYSIAELIKMISKIEGNIIKQIYVYSTIHKSIIYPNESFFKDYFDSNQEDCDINIKYNTLLYIRDNKCAFEKCSDCDLYNNQLVEVHKLY